MGTHLLPTLSKAWLAKHIIDCFCNECNKLNNKKAQMFNSLYHIT